MRRVPAALACALIAFGAAAARADATPADGELAAVAHAVCDGCATPDRLVTLNPDGSGLRVIWSAPDPGDRLDSPAWSPDGNELAFTLTDAGSGTRILVYDFSTNSLTAVTEHAASVQGITIQDLDPAWTPDGTRILYHHVPYLTPAGGITQIAVSVNPDGTGMERLPEALDAAVTRAAWAPDGNSLSYVLPPALHVADADSDHVVVAAGALGPQAWAPGGGRIAFSQDTAAGGVALRTIAPDGGSPAGLTTPAAGAADTDPAYAPDGGTVVYDHAEPGAPPQLRAVPAGGGMPRLVFADPGIELAAPAWQPCTLIVTVSCTSIAPPRCPATASVTTQAGHAVALPPSGCNDPAGLPLTLSLVTGPAHGSVSGWTYTPAPGFTGQDTLAYRVTNGSAASNTTTMTILVVPVVAAAAIKPAALPARAPYLDATAEPRLDHAGRARLRASCDEACTLTLHLALRLHGHKRATDGPARSYRAAAGHAFSLQLRPKHATRPATVVTAWIIGTMRGAGGTRSVRVPVTR